MAVEYVKQNIPSTKNIGTLSLKALHKEIRNYLEKQRKLHKKCGSLGIVTMNKEFKFTCLCQDNGDLLIAASNPDEAIYTVTATNDGVGILAEVNMMMKYLDDWQDLVALALSGDNLAISVDGRIYVHDLCQSMTRLITIGPDMSPLSLKATSLIWLENSIVYCEGHCVKLYDNDVVSVISGGNEKGDVDGQALHSKLCQPVGICVEFDRNIYITDCGSGSIKMINRPLQGIVDFLSNLGTLLRAFNIHSKSRKRNSDKEIGNGKSYT